ncbi:hypothetical protein FOCC_FOCC015397 [Frankliniella occidentalis]|nr:hypothetical protein FOCC_FOCC015397 [Frankliniella occidentalis]
MHDVGEGCFKYGMCSVINFITRKYVSYDTLNDRVQAFFYGALEYGNKPPIITEESINSESLNLSAAEMFCLVRYFGLMVGDLIPNDDPVWKYYCVMVSIFDILSSPSISHPEIKFESKHREGKLYANASCNRINLPKSIAIKHQLKVCFRFMSRVWLCKKFDYPALDLCLESSDNFHEFSSVKLDFLKSWKRVQRLTTNTVRYSVGMVLVIALGEYFPVFASIHSIIVNDQSEDVCFLVIEMTALNFDEHVHAYQVKVDNVKWSVVSLVDHITYLLSVV